MALKTSLPTAFQPFVFRDGTLGAVWPWIHVRHALVGLRVGKPRISDLQYFQSLVKRMRRSMALAAT
jgi:hypothetical protein